MPFSFLRLLPVLAAPTALLLTAALPAQTLPDSPSALLARAALPSLSAHSASLPVESSSSGISTSDLNYVPESDGFLNPQTSPQQPSAAASDKPRRNITGNTGTQPHRILGLMPNYRTVSAGEIPPPPGFRQSFKIATRQAFDYSSFIFLGLTTSSAYWEDSHPSLDHYNGGNAVFWAYLWRGFLDKTDGTYQSAWILPTMLHEDTRYYALGHGSKWRRLGYSMSRVAIARTYTGHNTVNLAGLGGKVGAQAVSTTYYPPSSEPFGVLATKFGYACARDVGFTVFREFYPDIAIHILHRNP